MQVFYSLIAIFFLALLSLTVGRSTTGLESRMYVNEVVTQASGVATGVIESIGRKPFDSKTDTTKVSTFPAVTRPYQLTATSDFGGCIDFTRCEDIDDFDGLTFTTDRNGFEFSVTITVRYVNQSDPDTLPATQTYAKEVLVEVSNTYIKPGGLTNPISVPFRRVFSYQKSTSV